MSTESLFSNSVKSSTTHAQAMTSYECLLPFLNIIVEQEVSIVLNFLDFHLHYWKHQERDHEENPVQPTLRHIEKVKYSCT